MFASYLFALRDGLEAALIVGLVAAYVAKVGRRDLLGQVLLGALAAGVICLVLGSLIIYVLGNLPLVVQETLEGVLAIAAVAVLTWMLFWMRRQGRLMKGQLEHDVDVALARGAGAALVLMAFLAVAREGLELTLVLLPLLTAGNDSLLIGLAGLAGLLTAAGIGFLIFRFGVRVNLARFFTVTSVILIFVAAGMCMLAVHEFEEAGLIPPTPHVFDLSGLLPVNGVIGSLLAGLLGYQQSPTVVQAIAYFAYLIPVLGYFLLSGRQPRRQVAAAA